MPKLTLEDKRRETLRRQLYGKEVSVVRVKQTTSSSSDKENNTKTFSFTNQPTISSPLPTTTYLAKDLTKVLLFSFLAIGIQLSLYFLLQHNLVKLPF